MTPIILQFGANTDRARSAMSQLATTVSSNMGSIASVLTSTAATTSTATALMGTGFGNAAAAALRFAVQYRVLLASLTVVGLAISKSAGDLAELVSIGDRASAVRLSPETFQGFLREADKARIAIKDAESALAAFSRANKQDFNATAQSNPSQASPLGKLLQDLVLVQRQLENSPALDKFLGSENDNERLRATIEIIRELQRAGQDLAAVKVSETAFGFKDGEKFAEQIRAGRFELDKAIEDGKGLGVIFDNDLVQRAVALRDRLSDAAREIGDNLTPLLSGSVTVAEALATAFVGAAEAAAKITSVVSGVASAIAGAAAQAASLVRTLGQTPEGIAGLEAKAARRRAADQGIRDNNAGALSPDAAARVKLAAGLGTPLGQEQSAFGRAVNQSLGGSRGRSVITDLPVDRPEGLDRPTGGGRGGRSGGRAAAPSIDERLETVTAYIEALERANRLVRAEVETFGKGNVEREKAIALSKLNVETTEAERQKIIEVATATGQYRDKLAELERAQRQNAEAARYFGDVGVDALTDLFIEGEKADKVLQNIGKSLARSALQGLLAGQGPIAGIFGGGKGGLLGSIFGGLTGKATGGSVFGGTPYLVGENGPEIYVPNASGQIIPNGAISTASSASSIQNTFVFNAPGADAAALRALQLEVRSLQSGFGPNVAGVLRNMELRGTRP